MGWQIASLCSHVLLRDILCGWAVSQNPGLCIVLISPLLLLGTEEWAHLIYGMLALEHHCLPEPAVHFISFQFSSVQFSCLVMSSSFPPHGLQHARPSCPSPTPGVCSNSCPLSQWCHPTISSSVVPFSFHLQSFPASRSFQMSQFFASGGQSIGVSALSLWDR